MLLNTTSIPYYLYETETINAFTLLCVYICMYNMHICILQLQIKSTKIEEK